MKKEFFIRNREKLFKLIDGDFTLVSFSGMPKRRSADGEYPFLANRDFVYLTGIEFKEIVYMATRKDNAISECIYCPPVDAITERWHGRMLHVEDIEKKSGIICHKSRNEFISDFWNNINNISPKLYLDIDKPESLQELELSQQFMDRVINERPEIKVCDYFPLMQKLRSVKEPEEIDSIKKAIEITAEGIDRILKTARPGVYEYNVRAEFEKVLADNGVHEPAFPTIVGAGKNSLCLHYSEEDCLIEDGDLVLLDLGAVYDYECADISRVFPANGKFTENQKCIAQLCADTVDYVCTNAAIGMSIKNLNEMQDEYLLNGLKQLGLAENKEDVKKYRWHSISHHLGMDTHDSCGREMEIQVGSVVTLEVGVYVEEWGFGVRIEDDMLMTQNGGVNLSKDIIPRTPDEIERAMAL